MPEKNAPIVGIVRRGNGIQIAGRARGSGCEGDWFRVNRGVVCTTDGFEVTRTPKERDQRKADRAQSMPYQYGQIKRRDGVPRFFRLPGAG